MTDEIEALAQVLRGREARVRFGQTGFYVKGDATADARTADALSSLSTRVKELEDGLQMLVDAADSFQDAATAYFTDSTYDGDGVLADTQSTLDVLALPVARALLQKDKA